MALTEQHRNTLYQGLTQAVGDEEAVAAMLSQLPAGDDEVATKSFVRAELAEQFAAQDRRMDERFATKDFVRAEVGELRADTNTGFGELRADTNTGFGELRADMNTGFGEVRTEIKDVELRLSEKIAGTTDEIKDFVHRELRAYMVWSYGALFALLAAVVMAAKLLQ